MTISFWPSSPYDTCTWFCVGMLIWSLISCWACSICRLGLSQAFRLDTGRIYLCHTCISGLVARYANQHWFPSYQHLYHTAPSGIWRARSYFSCWGIWETICDKQRDFWTLAQRDHSSISRHDLGHWSLLCNQHIVLPCSVLSEGSLQVYHSCRHVMEWQSFFRLQDLMVMTTDDWSHVWHTTIWHFHGISIKNPVIWMPNMEM